MGKGRTINSSNKGYWFDDSHLTAKFEDENDSFERLKNVINRYTNFRKNNEVDFSGDHLIADDSKVENHEFNLPDINKFYDVYNSKRFSKKIQSWQGIVLSITKDSFRAKLLDLTSGGTYEIGEFDLEDVSPDDLTLLDVGSVFYWSVGHYMENGQSVKRSDIRFQRLITLDEDDIDTIQNNIERKYSKLKEKKLA